MSNLNAHIRKSHGMSWQEAERQTGISAKTGELLVADGSNNVDIKATNITLVQDTTTVNLIPSTLFHQS